MKIVAYTHGVAPSWGVVEDDGIIDLGRRQEAGMASFVAALTSGSLMDIAMEAAGLSPDHSLESVRLLPPVPESRRIVFARIPGRFEPTDGRGLETVLGFVPGTGPLLGEGQPIHLPGPGAELCVAGALAVVIGGEANHVREDRALEYVAGYSCVADLSRREVSGGRARAPVPWGPHLVTPDEVGELGELVITTRLNGVMVGECRLADMAFSVAEVLAEVSVRHPLAAGDLLVVCPGELGQEKATGGQGDRYEVEIDRVGLLQGRIAG